MSEKKLSLFELHFHDAVQFGPRTLDGLGRDEGTGEEQPAGIPSDDEPAVLEEEAVADEDESGPCIVCRLVGLGVLAVAAYAVKKLLGGEPSGLDALDDIEAGEDASESADSEEAVSIEVTSGEESEASSRKGLAAAAVVALLVVLALVVRKLLGDAVEDLEVPEELAEE